MQLHNDNYFFKKKNTPFVNIMFYFVDQDYQITIYLYATFHSN